VRLVFRGKVLGEMHRIIFSIGPFTLYSYGLCVAIAFLISTVFILRDAKKNGFKQADILDCLIMVFLSGLIGGRLLYVLINAGYYFDCPLRILMFYEGGLAFQGALVGAVVSGVVVTRVKKLSFRKVADLIVPYMALGQAIGRIGCFLNGCCYGKVISFGPAVTFPGDAAARMPVQLYSSFILFLFFLFLLKIRKKHFFDGCVFALYLAVYGIFRFFMDFLRGDELSVFFGIKLSQIIGAGTFLCGVLIFIVFKCLPPMAPEAPEEYGKNGI